MKWILKSGVLLAVVFVYFGLVDWPTNASNFNGNANGLSTENSIVKHAKSAALESTLESSSGINILPVNSQNVDTSPLIQVSLDGVQNGTRIVQYKRYLYAWSNALILLRNLDQLFPFHSFL